jgi:hypothetical protein
MFIESLFRMQCKQSKLRKGEWNIFTGGCENPYVEKNNYALLTVSLDIIGHFQKNHNVVNIVNSFSLKLGTSCSCQ